MDDASVNYLLRWAPTLVAAFILVAVGFLLLARNQRESAQKDAKGEKVPQQTP